MSTTLALTPTPGTRSTPRLNSVSIRRFFFAFATAPEPLAATNDTGKNEKITVFQPIENSKPLKNNRLKNRSLYQVVNIRPRFWPIFRRFRPGFAPEMARFRRHRKPAQSVLHTLQPAFTAQRLRAL